MFESLLGLLLGHLVVPCLGYYSSDFSFFLLLKEEFTLLKKATNISGSDSLAVISLCVFLHFLQQDFIILLVQGIIINPIIQNIIFYYSTKISLNFLALLVLK